MKVCGVRWRVAIYTIVFIRSRQRQSLCELLKSPLEDKTEIHNFWTSYNVGSRNEETARSSSIPVTIRRCHQSFSCTFCLIFKKITPYSPTTDIDKGYKRAAKHKRHRKQDNIDWDWVSVEKDVCRGVKRRFQEIEQSREADYQPIYFAEGLKAKDLGRIVGDGSVVERAVDDKETDVCDCCPHVWEAA